MTRPFVISTILFVGSSLVALTVKLKQNRRRKSSIKSSTRLSKEQVFEIRKKYLSKSNSVSYENTGPLMILQVKLLSRSDEFSEENRFLLVTSNLKYIDFIFVVV